MYHNDFQSRILYHNGEKNFKSIILLFFEHLSLTVLVMYCNQKCFSGMTSLNSTQNTTYISALCLLTKIKGDGTRVKILSKPCTVILEANELFKLKFQELY